MSFPYLSSDDNFFRFPQKNGHQLQVWEFWEHKGEGAVKKL
jgi:hypothetical protein